MREIQAQSGVVPFYHYIQRNKVTVYVDNAITCSEVGPASCAQNGIEFGFVSS